MSWYELVWAGMGWYEPTGIHVYTGLVYERTRLI